MNRVNIEEVKKRETRKACTLYKTCVFGCVAFVIVAILDLITGKSVWDICSLFFILVSVYNFFMAQKSSKMGMYITIAGVTFVAFVFCMIMYFVF